MNIDLENDRAMRKADAAVLLTKVGTIGELYRNIIGIDRGCDHQIFRCQTERCDDNFLTLVWLFSSRATFNPFDPDTPFNPLNHYNPKHRSPERIRGETHKATRNTSSIVVSPMKAFARPS
jgi:hypothetical protein